MIEFKIYNSDILEEKMRISKLKILLFFVFIFIINGCTALNHSVQVSSYSTGTAGGNRYFLAPTEEKKKDKTLVFQLNEIERYTDMILAKKGFVKVNNIKNADQYIIYDFRISEPQPYTYSYDEPVWDTVMRPYTRYRKIDGRYYPYTYWDRDYEVVGYRTKVRTKTIFVKNIQLTAFNKSRTKNLWQVNGSMTDTSSDLRYDIPIMLRGMENYIGVDSGQVINVEIPDNDMEVELMRKGIIQSSAVAQ